MRVNGCREVLLWGARANALRKEIRAKAPAPQTEVQMLLVHCLHNGTYDPGKDRTAARAANRIAEKAAQRSAGSRIRTRSTPKEGTKKCTSSDTADRTAKNFGQLAHRHLLQDRTDSLTAEDASNNLNNNRKNAFHVEIPPKKPGHNRPRSQRLRVVHRNLSSSKVQRPPIKQRFLTPWCSVYALFFLRVAAALAAVARRLRVAAALHPAARRFRV